MALTVNDVTVPPFKPGSTGYLYKDDQLIAGDAKLVTRGQATITGGLALPRGTVMGKVTIGAIAAGAGGGNTGDGSIGSLVAGTKTIAGVYLFTAIDANNWNVRDPNGLALPPAKTGVAYSNANLNALITAGGTPFAAGDTLTATVAAGSSSWKKSVKTAVDGSQVPAGILVDAADASGGDVNGGIYLTGEFNENRVSYDNGWTLAELRDLLRVYSIWLKSAITADPAS